MTEEKVRENRIRRMAQRQGYELKKSRRRDPKARGFGGYMLWDVEKNLWVVGYTPHPYSADIDEVEAFLTE